MPWNFTPGATSRDRSEAEASRFARASLMLYLASAEALVHQAAAELGHPDLARLVCDPHRPLPLADAWGLLPAVMPGIRSPSTTPAPRPGPSSPNSWPCAPPGPTPAANRPAALLPPAPRFGRLRAPRTSPGPARPGPLARPPRLPPHRITPRPLRPPPPTPRHHPQHPRLRHRRPQQTAGWSLTRNGRHRREPVRVLSAKGRPENDEKCGTNSRLSLRSSPGRRNTTPPCGVLKPKAR